jgi:2'-5' RNA ligase
MPPDSLRLFIAIELPPAVREALSAVQKRLQAFDSERAVRWSVIDSIHLTLKFLGETPASRRPEIEAALQQAVTGHEPFELDVYGVGSFRDRMLRVVWAGVGGDLAALYTLRDAVERTVSPLGYPTEGRPFSPHLTLGRARKDAARSAALADLRKEIGKGDILTVASWRVEGISLMRSDLKPSGAVYTQLAFAALGG